MLRSRLASCIRHTIGVGGTGTVGDMGTEDIRIIIRCMIEIVVSVEGRGVFAVEGAEWVGRRTDVVGALVGEWE